MTLPVMVVDQPYIPPFWCGRCRADAGSREWFLDTGIDVEVPGATDGRMFICNKCVDDFVQAIPGYYTKQDLDAIVEANQNSLAAADKSIKTWSEKVLAFHKLGIDLEKVWENLNGRDDPTAISSDPDPEPIDPEPASIAGPIERDDAGTDQSDGDSNPFLDGITI